MHTSQRSFVQVEFEAGLLYMIDYIVLLYLIKGPMTVCGVKKTKLLFYLTARCKQNLVCDVVVEGEVMTHVWMWKIGIYTPDMKWHVYEFQWPWSWQPLRNRIRALRLHSMSQEFHARVECLVINRVHHTMTTYSLREFFFLLLLLVLGLLWEVFLQLNGCSGPD